jgi:hypothetical protein
MVQTVAAGWVDDPENDVVYTEELEGRTAVRVAQQTRDFTTIWFEVGDRTLSLEAYVLPAPPRNAAEVHRQCLFRNHSARLVHFSIDKDGEIYLRARVPLEMVTPDLLESLLAETYEHIEIAFRPLVRAGFGRG